MLSTDYRDTATDSPEDRAAKAFQAAVKFHSSLYKKGSADLEIAIANALGQNILREEIGYFEDPLNAAQPYKFDSRTRDRLAAHTRQDVAALYGLVTSLTRSTINLRRQVVFLWWGAIMIAATNISLLVFIALAE
ncbi:hypothetical protein [Cereibacter sphaeroides]|uniref:hypothetical protein n=1 Tax=Cereibacter sphaeroides TaxID=1063 RepID=UPI00117B312A|nr:hypothetical protein [Cereibacter sphaeroides]